MVGANPVSAEPSITNLEDYLAGRKRLIAGREVLFAAARTYLRPSQRPDARQLGDELWNASARVIEDADWVANAARGYLTVLENEASARYFRLCVLQQGNALRVGVRLPNWFADSVHDVPERILNTFGTLRPIVTYLTTGELMVDWHFDAERLYTQAQAMEDAVYRISALFESALQSNSYRENPLQ